MREIEDETLTGGVGNAEPDEETMTGGIENRSPEEDETFTGGAGADLCESDTMTGGIADISPEDETLTGGIGNRPTENLTMTGGIARKKEETKSGTPAKTIGRPIDVDWKVGDEIDERYKVTGVIGRGGMGAVFKVRHLEWRIDMAVKMPLGKLVSDEGYKSRFVRESQTWVDLGLHPNIVQCWYVREMCGVPRLFMEYMKGGSLKDWMRKGRIGKDDWEKILDLIIQAADGLGYAHENGVVHRDVKPANMLMSPDGRLCVTDFGLVKISGLADIETGDVANDSAEGSELTRPGSTLGTPEYSAPEQWDRSMRVDARADIYALGVMLFEMCCGRRPFDDGKHKEPPLVLMGRHRYSFPPNPTKFSNKMTDALSRIIMKCLEKNPEDRPKSMAVFREDLVGIFWRLTGKKYTRPVPEPGDLRADSLNNKAVSLWDLGKKADALAALEKALGCDPQHLEATRNICIHGWEEAKSTDRDFLDRIEALEKIQGRRADYWRTLSEIHFFRGSLDEAKKMLEKTLRIDPEESRAAGLLSEIKRFSGKKEIGTGEVHAFRAFPGSVFSLCFGKDEGYCFSGNSDGTVFRWDAGSGEIIHKAKMHGGSVNAMAVSPNGQVGLSGGSDKTARLWNTSTGKRLRVYKGHDEAVNCVAFTPDGKYGVTGSSDTTLRVWDLGTEKCVRVLKGHYGPVTCLAVSPNGKFVLSAGAGMAFGAREYSLESISKGPLRLWDISRGNCLRIFRVQTGDVYAAAISPDGRTGLSAGSDMAIHLWDLYNGKTVRVLSGHSGAVAAATFSPNGRLILSGGYDNTMRLWETETGRCLRTFEGHADAVTSVAFSPNSRLAAAASPDGTMKLWRIHFRYEIPPMDLSMIKQLKALKEERSAASFLAKKAVLCLESGKTDEAVDILSKAREIEGFERDGELLKLWHRAAKGSARAGLKTAWPVRYLKGHNDAVNCVAATPDSKFCISGSSDKSVGLWDISSGNSVRFFRWYKFTEESLTVRTLEGRTDEVYSAAASADGNLCLSGGYFKNLLLWELSSGECVKLFEGHAGSVNSVALNPQGRTAFSGSRDGTLILWDLAAGRQIRNFKGHDGEVNAAAVSPDGRFGLSGGADRMVRIWRLSNGECLNILDGHTGYVNDAVFSPNGRFGLTASSDGSMRLWNLSSGKCLLVLKGPGPVNSAAFGPEGNFAFSASGRAMQVWKLSTGERLHSFEGHSGRVKSVAVTPDGRYAMTASTDKTIGIWELDWDLRPFGTERSLAEMYGIDSDKVVSATGGKKKSAKPDNESAGGFFSRFNPLRSKKNKKR